MSDINAHKSPYLCPCGFIMKGWYDLRVKMADNKVKEIQMHNWETKTWEDSCSACKKTLDQEYLHQEFRDLLLLPHNQKDESCDYIYYGFCLSDVEKHPYLCPCGFEMRGWQDLEVNLLSNDEADIEMYDNETETLEKYCSSCKKPLEKEYLHSEFMTLMDKGLITTKENIKS